MKTIYLIRHAKSFWGDQSLPDFDRPLNKRGKRDAPFMGEVLREKNIKPDYFISSPAKRTKKTAIIISDKLNFPAKNIVLIDELYEATSIKILDVINTLDEKYESVVIVAHNPGLTLLNNYISDKYIDNIPTCGIVGLQVDKKWKKIGKNSCAQLFFEYPKLYLK